MASRTDLQDYFSMYKNRGSHFKCCLRNLADDFAQKPQPGLTCFQWHTSNVKNAVVFSFFSKSRIILVSREGSSLVFTPLVLFPNLLFFGGIEVARNIELLPDILGRLAFDHVGDGFAGHVEERLDV